MSVAAPSTDITGLPRIALTSSLLRMACAASRPRDCLLVTEPFADGNVPLGVLPQATRPPPAHAISIVAEAIAPADRPTIIVQSMLPPLFSTNSDVVAMQATSLIREYEVRCALLTSRGTKLRFPANGITVIR